MNTCPRSLSCARQLLSLFSVLLGVTLICTGNVLAQTQLAASNRAAADYFGSAVAISGTVAVIGASHRGPDNSGAAYVFEKDPLSGNWIESATLGGYAGGWAGSTVATDGNTVAVGAPNALSTQRGAVLIHAHASNWALVQTLFSPDGGDGVHFGSSVAVAGDTLLVGASGALQNGSHCGAVYVYKFTTMWSYVQKLSSPSCNGAVSFGAALSLSGNTLAVGAPGPYNASGSVSLFDRDINGAWNLVVTRVPSDGYANQAFGNAVAISADTLVVAACNGVDPGHVYVFERDLGEPNSWGQESELSTLGTLTTGAGYLSIAVQGDTILVGMPNYNGNRGAVYVYQRAYSGLAAWEKVSRLPACHGPAFLVANDSFGNSVAVEGTTIFVGTTGEDVTYTDTGAAYIYEWVAYPGSCRRPGLWWEPVRMLLED